MRLKVIKTLNYAIKLLLRVLSLIVYLTILGVLIDYEQQYLFREFEEWSTESNFNLFDFWRNAKEIFCNYTNQLRV